MNTTVEDVLSTMNTLGLEQVVVTREMYRRAESEGFPTDRMIVNCFLDQSMSDSQIKHKESVKGPRNRWGGDK